MPQLADLTFVKVPISEIPSALLPQEAQQAQAASEAALRACEQQREQLVEAVAPAADQGQRQPHLQGNVQGLHSQVHAIIGPSPAYSLVYVWPPSPMVDMLPYCHMLRASAHLGYTAEAS